MIAVLQRVNRAAVRVEGETVGEIGHGLLVFLGVAEGDYTYDVDLLVKKIAACRIFKDENGKMNRSVKDVGGSVLVISNFTLLADYTHGNRPSYFGAATPHAAEIFYLEFVWRLSREVKEVQKGSFGEDMEIDMEADGPVTIVMDSRVLKNKGKKGNEA